MVGKDESHHTTQTGTKVSDETKARSFFEWSGFTLTFLELHMSHALRRRVGLIRDLPAEPDGEEADLEAI